MYCTRGKGVPGGLTGGLGVYGVQGWYRGVGWFNRGRVVIHRLSTVKPCTGLYIYNLIRVKMGLVVQGLILFVPFRTSA